MNITNRIAIGLVVLGLIGALVATFKSKPPAEPSIEPTPVVAKVEKKKNTKSATNNSGAVAQLEANPSFSDKVPPPPTPEQTAQLNIQ